MTEIVYILTNPVFPDLVKIGRTKNLEERVRSLSSQTGVPVPFEVYYSCTVDDSKKVEKHLHDGFSDHRINPRREFFRINPERVLSILKLVEIEDVTPNDEFVENEDELVSLNNEKTRRSSFKFSSVGIKPGSVPNFVRDEGITVTVIDDKNVEFEGNITSLSQSSLVLLNRDFGKDWKTVRGPDYWVYNNETLSELRVRLETEE